MDLGGRRAQHRQHQHLLCNNIAQVVSAGTICLPGFIYVTIIYLGERHDSICSYDSVTYSSSQW